ncbi:MAG: putative iron dependent alcohol dehydrogenase [Promethearchaeota archaeon]|nr:MAG: putative iron dependent alcohol dehydrogenase [Candidatus Lokiarchaeota archaeon]
MSMSERDKEIEKEAMKIFEEWPRTKIIFGKNTLKETGKYAKEFGENALIVIGGGSVKKFGYLNELTNSLESEGIVHSLYEGVEPNPPKATVEDIAETFNGNTYDITVAIGGGSTMDAAKAALILTGTGNKDINKYFGVNKVSAELDRISPCICIPTTSGTSSEITRYSNVTLPEKGVKKLISDIAIHPHYAIVDPTLTMSCPQDLTLTVGLDTMTHSMEGYLNRVQDEGNEDINKRALMSLELVFRWLKVAVKEPKNYTARKMMAIASVLGGTVIGGKRFKGTAGPHMNSFSWAETIAHGKATGIMMPYYIAYYGKNDTVMKKLEPIAEMLGVEKGEKIGLNVAQAMLNWYDEMEFPTKISDLEGWKSEYKDKAIEDAAENTMKLEAMPNPVQLDKVEETIGPILEAAIDGELSKLE